MNDEFKYTDHDGDRVRAGARRGNDDTAAWIQVRRSDGTPATGFLSTDAARDLATKLLEWSGEPTPPAPTFTVGDRVEVFGWGDGTYWDGPATVTDVWDARARLGEGYSVRPDAAPSRVGFFEPKYIRALPTPDYAALAAKFKPGDLAIVSDNPGTEAEPGSGFVEDDFNGKAVNVVSAEDDPYAESDHFGPECVRVALGNGDTNYIHVAHLTRVEAVKW